MANPANVTDAVNKLTAILSGVDGAASATNTNGYINLGIQMAAVGANLNLTPGNTVAAVTGLATAQIAIGAQLAITGNDFFSYKADPSLVNKGNLIADAASLIGDGIMFYAAEKSTEPFSGPALQKLSLVGDALAWGGATAHFLTGGDENLQAFAVVGQVTYNYWSNQLTTELQNAGNILQQDANQLLTDSNFLNVSTFFNSFLNAPSVSTAATLGSSVEDSAAIAILGVLSQVGISGLSIPAQTITSNPTLNSNGNLVSETGTDSDGTSEAFTVGSGNTQSFTINSGTGTSQVFQYNTTTNTSVTTNYSGANGTGSVTGSAVDSSNAAGETTELQYNASGTLTSATVQNADGITSSITNAGTDAYDLGLPTGQSITLSNVQSLTPDANGGYQLTDTLGNTYNFDPIENSFQYKLTGANGFSAVVLAPDVPTILLGSSVTLDLITNGTVTINQTTPTITYSDGGGSTQLGTTQQLFIGNDLLGIGTPGDAGTLFQLMTPLSNGSTHSDASDFLLGDPTGSISQLATAVASLSTAIGSAYAVDAPVGSVTTSIYNPIQSISVVNLTGSGDDGSSNGDSGGLVAGGDVIVGPGVSVAMGYDLGTTTATESPSDNIANTPGLVNNSAADMLTGEWRPNYQQTIDPSQNIVTLASPQAQAVGSNANMDALAAQALSDYAYMAPSLEYTDPLLVDLTGNGIQVSNWIGNDVYFDTNVNAAGTAPDGMEHHTSWMDSGTGMLVFDPSSNTGGNITNITQTVSEYLNVGYGVGVGPTAGPHAAETDGLAALTNLATAGSAVFNATTSLTDPLTGVKYYNEIMVAQGNPSSSGTVAASQLESLSAAGIASISLVGSGNLGTALRC